MLKHEFINPADCVDVFDALNTIYEDVEEQEAAKDELLTDTATPEEVYEVAEMYRESLDELGIDARKDYIASHLGKLIYSQGAALQAEQIYRLRIGYESLDEAAQLEAGVRIQRSHQFIAHAALKLITRDRNSAPVRQPVRGRPSADGRGIWYDPTDPRGTETSSPRSADRIIAAYNIVEQRRQDNGDIEVIYLLPGRDQEMQTKTIDARGINSHRIGLDGKTLQLTINHDRRSVWEEAGLEEPEGPQDHIQYINPDDWYNLISTGMRD